MTSCCCCAIEVKTCYLYGSRSLDLFSTETSIAYGNGALRSAFKSLTNRPYKVEVTAQDVWYINSISIKADIFGQSDQTSSDLVASKPRNHNLFETISDLHYGSICCSYGRIIFAGCEAFITEHQLFSDFSSNNHSRSRCCRPLRCHWPASRRSQSHGTVSRHWNGHPCIISLNISRCLKSRVLDMRLVLPSTYAQMPLECSSHGGLTQREHVWLPVAPYVCCLLLDRFRCMSIPRPGNLRAFFARVS